MTAVCVCVCVCVYLQVEARGVLSGVLVRARSHWSSSSSSSSSVGPPSAARQPIRVHITHRPITQHSAVPSVNNKGVCVLKVLTSDVHLPGDVHGRGQVPHLDAAVAVAAEQVAPSPRADPTRALALVDREGRDGGTVH